MVNKWLAAGLAVLLMATVGGVALAEEPGVVKSESLQQEQLDGDDQAHAHGWPGKKAKKSEHFQIMIKVMEQKEALFELTLHAAEKGNVEGIQAVKGYHAKLKELGMANKQLRQKLMTEREALHQARKTDDKQAVQTHRKEMKKAAEEMHHNLKATSELLDKAIKALR